MDKLGNPLLGERGVIFAKGADLEVNHLGEVYLDGVYADRLLVYRFEDEGKLEKVGFNHYFWSQGEEGRSLVPYPAVKQGALEGSNVNAVKNLTDMILAHRCYEAYQKAIQHMDSLMDKTSNTLGSLQG